MTRESEYKWIAEWGEKEDKLFLRILESMWEQGKEQAKLIAELFQEHKIGKGKRILDAGCGIGRISIPLAQMGYEVHCLDRSPLFIKTARKKISSKTKKLPINFIVGDAYQLTSYFEKEYFDAILVNWTTILGYNKSIKMDKKFFAEAYKTTRKNGLMFILNQAIIETLVTRRLFVQDSSFYVEIDSETVMVEKSFFDHEKSILYNTWSFYKKKDKNLQFIDELKFSMRLYCLHEIVEMAKKAGWSPIRYFDSFLNRRRFNVGFGFNVVFEKK